MKKQNIFQKAGFLVKDFFKHWNIPAKEGYYLSNKEFMAYSVGGMGVQGMGILTQYFAINMGVHLAYVYNFDQMIVLYTTWIMAILSLFRAPLVGWLIDNTNSKWGRYRPYLLWAGFASVACFWLLAFIPNIFMPGEGQEYTTTRKWLVIGSYQLIYFIALTVYSLFAFGRVGLSQVITPNTNERTKLYSVGGVIDSLGPSIVQMLFPLIANGVYGQMGLVYKDKYGELTAEQITEMGLGFGMENIYTYQIIFPIMGCICVALALVMFFGTKERIIKEKKAKASVGFWSGIKKSFKNKYFWLFNLSSVLAFGRITLFASVNYVCAYMIGGDLGGTLRGIVPTLMAVGFVPGMLFSPIIQKYMGKKNMTLLSFGGSAALSVLILMLVLFAYNWGATPYLIFVGVFLHNIFAALWTVTSPAMTADYCEYQQWKTGDRLDGYMSQYSQVITTICGLGSGALVAFLLKKYGANESADYANPEVMRSAFIIWCVLGIVCGVLAMIPFFFWNLTEKKQLEMARDLKIKAYTNDLEKGELDEENVKEAVELGVLTREQALEMGFASVMEAQTEEDASEQLHEEQTLLMSQMQDTQSTDSVVKDADETKEGKAE